MNDLMAVGVLPVGVAQRRLARGTVRNRALVQLSDRRSICPAGCRPHGWSRAARACLAWLRASRRP